jgi:hypothetical protein
MEDFDRWASDGNICLFADQLRWETNPARQETLRRLLIEEEDRFGATEERLRLVKRRLEDNAALIVRQRRRIAEMKRDGADTSSAERLLQTFEMIQNLFERFASERFGAIVGDMREWVRP